MKYRSAPLPIIAAAVLQMMARNPAEAQTTVTLFGTATPQTPVDPDTNSVTLGVQFYSTQAGTINGVRFYRGAKSSSGYQVGIFDGTSGARLAYKAVTTDPCATMPCWEEIDFASPLSISANKTYVSTYWVKGGHYAGDNQGLANKVTSGPLTAPGSSSIAGGNGVYIYGTKLLRPNSTYQASNYYVDVAFTPSAPPPPSLVMSFNPPNPSIAADTPPGTAVAMVLVDWSDDVNGSHPFTGTIGFAQPFSNDGGVFALSGNAVYLNSAGPGIANDAGTVQNITLTAVQ
jgi:hypothetical protein